MVSIQNNPNYAAMMRSQIGQHLVADKRLQPQGPAEKFVARALFVPGSSQSESSRKANQIALIVLAAIACLLTLGLAGIAVNHFVKAYKAFQERVNEVTRVAIKEFTDSLTDSKKIEEPVTGRIEAEVKLEEPEPQGLFAQINVHLLRADARMPETMRERTLEMSRAYLASDKAPALEALFLERMAKYLPEGTVISLETLKRMSAEDQLFAARLQCVVSTLRQTTWR